MSTKKHTTKHVAHAHKQTKHSSSKESRMEDQNTVPTSANNPETGSKKTVVLTVAIATVVLIVAGGVWLATRKDTKQTKTNTAVVSGKQQFCESRSSVCWSYPKDWTMGSDEAEDGENIKSVQVIEGKDSAKTLNFTYTAPVTTVAGNADFVPYYVGDVSDASELKVVGGVYPSKENTPYFYVVDKAAAATLTSAKTVSFSSSPTFTNKGTKDQVQAMVVATGTTFASPEAAKTFFDNDTAAQARSVLQSISFKDR